MNEMLIYHLCKLFENFYQTKLFDFRIPPSTSRELADLITRILKRNPKERIDYEEFFNHPFLKKSILKKNKSHFCLINKNFFFRSTCKYIKR
jgi:serine/threonine protein kinase